MPDKARGKRRSCEPPVNMALLDLYPGDTPKSETIEIATAQVKKEHESTQAALSKLTEKTKAALVARAVRVKAECERKRIAIAAALSPESLEIRKRVLRSIRAKLSNENIRLPDLYRQLADGSATLSSAAFTEGMRSLNVDATNAQLLELFRAADTTRKGHLTLSDFALLIGKPKSPGRKGDPFARSGSPRRRSVGSLNQSPPDHSEARNGETGMQGTDAAETTNKGKISRRRLSNTILRLRRGSKKALEALEDAAESVRVRRKNSLSGQLQQSLQLKPNVRQSNVTRRAKFFKEASDTAIDALPAELKPVTNNLTLSPALERRRQDLALALREMCRRRKLSYDEVFQTLDTHGKGKLGLDLFSAGIGALGLLLGVKCSAEFLEAMFLSAATDVGKSYLNSSSFAKLLEPSVKIHSAEMVRNQASKHKKTSTSTSHHVLDSGRGGTGHPLLAKSPYAAKAPTVWSAQYTK